MKYKYAVALLSLTLCTSTLMMNGCEKNTSTSSTDGQVLYGEVVEVSDDSITIALETEDDDSTSGEEQTIKVTDDTEITKESTGGPGGQMPSGEAPNGEAPIGNAPGSDTQNGEAPSGEAPNADTQSGNTPSGEVPAKPDGDTSTDGTTNGNTNGEPPAKPDGDTWGKTS